MSPPPETEKPSWLEPVRVSVDHVVVAVVVDVAGRADAGGLGHRHRERGGAAQAAGAALVDVDLRLLGAGDHVVVAVVVDVAGPGEAAAQAVHAGHGGGGAAREARAAALVVKEALRIKLTDDRVVVSVAVAVAPVVHVLAELAVVVGAAPLAGPGGAHTRAGAVVREGLAVERRAEAGAHQHIRVAVVVHVAAERHADAEVCARLRERRAHAGQHRIDVDGPGGALVVHEDLDRVPAHIHPRL